MRNIGIKVIALVALCAGCIGEGSLGSVEQHGGVALQPPTVSATAISPTRIEVSWTSSANATKYYLFSSTGGAPLTYVTTVLGTNYSDANLTPSTEYSYMVHAADDMENQSADSNIASATTPAAPQQIGIPQDLTAVAVSSSRIELDWSTVSGAVKYYVFQAEGAGPSGYLGTALSNSFTVSGLAQSTTYTYVVQAVDAFDIQSADSDPASATTPLPGASGASAIAVSSSRIEVTWDPVPGAVKYYVLQAEGTGPFLYVTTAQTPGYVAANLNANTTYQFQIMSVDQFDNASPEVATAGATTFPGGSAASPPINVTATATSTSRINVTWGVVANATKYYVFQAQGIGPSMYVGTALTNSFEATGLAANTSYSFVVQAVDANDIPSADSATATAMTLSDAPPLDAPENVIATAISSSQIEVSWDEVSGAVKYYVFQAVGNGPMMYVTTVPTPYTSLSVTGLSADTEYSYVVEAVDANDQRSSASAPPATAATFE